MPLYFAYGSNMDRRAMAARCPGSRVIGPARLARHRLVVMREGYASVARDARREVWGILWDLALADIPALDRYEEVASGLYRKAQQPVLTDAGPRKALVYLGRNAGPGRPLPGYMEVLHAAALAADLPAAYCSALAAHMPGRPGPAPEPPPKRAVTPTRATPRDPVADRNAGWNWEP